MTMDEKERGSPAIPFQILKVVALYLLGNFLKSIIGESRSNMAAFWQGSQLFSNIFYYVAVIFFPSRAKRHRYFLGLIPIVSQVVGIPELPSFLRRAKVLWNRLSLTFCHIWVVGRRS